MTIRKNSTALVYPAILAALNAWLSAGLFGIEFSRFLGSIEGAYIAIARFTQSNWTDLTWWPLWYGGVPWANTYPPLLPWIVAALAQFAGLSPAWAHHIVVAAFFSAGPVTVYALAVRLSGSRFAAFLAGLVYSLVPASTILVSSIRADVGGLLLPQRLHVLLAYGEGPHIAALALLPLAVLALDRALERPTGWRYLGAALALGAVVLTNWLGAFALAGAVLALLVARTNRFNRQAFTPVVHALLIGAAAYCLVMPWVPPSLIATVERNAATVEGDYRHAYAVLPVFLLFVAAAFVVLKATCLRLRIGVATQFFVLWSVVVAGAVLAWSWLHIAVVPQPHRYQLEMDLALAASAALVARGILLRYPRRVAIVVCALAGVGLAWCALRDKSYARDLIQPANIGATSEYHIASWLDTHANGARAFVPGSAGFWLNVFSSVPQIGGGFDQGRLTHVNDIANYFIYTGDGGGEHDAEYSILWLKALGARMVAVTGPRSTEAYHPFHNPAKFNGLLPELWRDGDDAIYGVPGPAPSLAHVAAREELVSRAPENGIDVEPLRPYVTALDDLSRPLAKMTWLNHHQARIDTSAARGQLLSVQVNWSAGWRASVNGSERPVWQDALGFIVVDPGCDGPCGVDLVYDGGTEMKIARWLSLLTLVGLLGFGVRGSLRRVRDK